MSITSISFLLFIFFIIIVYYAMPAKKYQWVWLLAGSCCFYFAGGIKNGVYILITSTSTYWAARSMDDLKNKQSQYLSLHKDQLSREEKKRLKHRSLLKRRGIMATAMLLNFSILCTFKYLNFILGQAAAFLNIFSGNIVSAPTLRLVIPLGISFYTFQTMGYLADVYWEKAEAERNWGKVLLFTSFFPQMTQGPISSYGQLSQELFREHPFDYKNYSYGCQRMLWGFYKKMVIADLLAPFVREAFQNYSAYPGVSILLSAFMYSVQIYADFSGYMDIVCGFSETLGITLSENFHRPYFSRSIAEYWRRWHITLGAWFKSYIYYPIAVSKWNRNLGKKAEKYLGASAAKTLPASVALVVTWLTTGLWHGASWGYIAWGMVNGFFIIFSLWMEPIYAKINKTLKINPADRRWILFQVIRTFLLVTFIKVLPEVGTLEDGFGFWKQIFTSPSLPTSLTELIPGYGGVSDLLNLAVILMGTCLLLMVSMIQRKRKVRDSIQILPRGIRWGIFAIIALQILIFGTGSARESFMYAQF